MGKCIECKGSSQHKTSCSKYKAPEKKVKKGRGMTVATDTDEHALNVCIEKLGDSTHLLYLTGSKSLVGGTNGKDSGLPDKSYRIDRQSTGNVQFQKKKVTLATVTFLPTTEADAIIQGLRLSLQNGTITRLGAVEED